LALVMALSSSRLIAYYVLFTINAIIFVRLLIHPSTNHEVSASESCFRTVVFSHRGAAPGFFPGSIESANWLMERGVCAFDVDIFETLDSRLLIGHPIEIQQRLGLTNGLTPENMGFDELDLLVLGQLASVDDFLRTVKFESAQCLKFRREATTPRILLEPKGASASASTIRKLAASARRAGFQAGDIGVWLTDPSLADIARHLGLLPLLPLKGSEAIPPNLLNWVAVGPPIHHPSIAVVAKKAYAAGLGLIIWVIDDSAQLGESLKLLAKGVVSNSPAQISAALLETCASLA
jgi:hypothetical protein